MKKLFLIMLAFASIAAKAQTNSSWVLRTPTVTTTSLPTRCFGVSFAIGANGYVATGEASSVILSDCWQYNASITSDLWQQKADVPGGGRSQAFGFALSGYGYVGGGGTSGGAMYDFYQYNTGSNTWTSKASLSTTSTFFYGNTNVDRIGSAYVAYLDSDYVSLSFVKVMKGMVMGGGSGFHTNYLDKNTSIAYDPYYDTWSAVLPNLPVYLYDAVGFTVKNNVYVTCGTGHGLTYNPTYWWTGGGGSWSAQGNFPGTSTNLRGKPFVFTLGTYAYAGLGYNTNGSINYDFTDVYSFNTTSAGWSCTVNTFTGGNRIAPSYFTITVNGVQRAYVLDGGTLPDSEDKPPIPTNTNYEYQPLYINTIVSDFCYPAHYVTIPFYADCNYPAGTSYTLQFGTVSGGVFKFITNLGVTTSSPFTNVQYPLENNSGQFILRIIANKGPVLTSDGSNLFHISYPPAVPNAVTAGFSSLCVGQEGIASHNEHYLTSTGTGASFIWTTSNGNASIVSSVNTNFGSSPPYTTYQNVATILGVNPGSVVVSVAGYYHGCTGPATTMSITITASPAPTITGSAYLTIGGSNVYTCASVPGITYTWSTTAASSIAGINALNNSATVTGYADGLVPLKVTAAGSICGNFSYTLPIEVVNAVYPTTCAGLLPLYFNPAATVNTFTGYDLSNPSNIFTIDLTTPKVDFTTYGSNVVLNIPGTLTFDGVYLWNFNNLTIMGITNFNPGTVLYMAGNIMEINGSSAQILGTTITGWPCSTNDYDWNYIYFANDYNISIDQGMDASGINHNSLFSGSKNGLIANGQLTYTGVEINPGGVVAVRNSIFKATTSGFSVYYNLNTGAMPMTMAKIKPLDYVRVYGYTNIQIYSNQFIKTGSVNVNTNAGIYLEYHGGPSPNIVSFQYLRISSNLISNFYNNIRLVGSYVPTTFVGSGFYCNTMTGANSNTHIYVTPDQAVNFNTQQVPSGNVFVGTATGIYNDGPAGTSLTYYVGATDQGVGTPGGGGSTSIQPSTYTNPCGTLYPGRQEDPAESIPLTPNSLGAPVPNPASYTVTLPYTIHIEASQHASVEVSNMTGNHIATYKLSYKEEQGEITIDLANFVSGLYVYRLVIDGKGIDIKKLMVVK